MFRLYPARLFSSSAAFSEHSEILSNCDGAGFARFDGSKPRRGLTRNTQHRAALIEHRAFPGSPMVSPAAPSASETAPAYVQDCSPNLLSPLTTGHRHALPLRASGP